MTKKSVKTVCAMLLFAFCVFLGVSCGGKSDSITLVKSELAMNLYDEIALSYHASGEVLWSSSDESVVLVDENGLVKAQGKRGDAKVIAKSGSSTAECDIKVRDRGISPVLEEKEARAFVNVAVIPKIYVNYNNVLYLPESVDFVSEDTDIVMVSDGKIIGVTIGETKLNITATWKKVAVKGKINVAVYAERSIIIQQERVNIYAVSDGTQAKRNFYTLQAETFDRGVAVESPEFSLSVNGENADYVTIDGKTVRVNKQKAAEIPSEGVETVVDVSCVLSGIETTAQFTVKVCPDYVKVDTLKEITDTKQAAIDLKIYDGEVNGKTNVIDYTITNVYKNAHATASPSASSWLNNVWANWNTRLEFVSTMTLNGISAYDFLQKEGYKYLSVDIYYQGHYNENGELMQSGMFFGTYGCSSYFYVDCRNDRDDIVIINSAGEITNTLKLNEWQTVYYDINALITAATVAGRNDCNLFLSSNHVGDVCYIDNVRYWLDDASLENAVDKRDLYDRKLVVDADNEAKAIAQLNEFKAYSDIYVDFAQTEFEGQICYKYDSTKPSEFKAFDIGRRNKINAYNDLNGLAVKRGYEYVVFDIYVSVGEPRIVYYDLFERKENTLVLKNGAKTVSRGVKFFGTSDGKKETETFTTGRWISVSVRIDGKAKENLYITSVATSVFYVKNVNYYKNNSFVYEYSADAQLRAMADGVESCYFIGDELDVRACLETRMGGIKTEEYDVVSVSGLGGIAVYNQNTGKITAENVGKTTVKVSLNKNGHTCDVDFILRIDNEKRIVLNQNVTEIYGGSGEFGFVNATELEIKAYENKKRVANDRLTCEIVSGCEYISLTGTTITAIKAGANGEPVVATVKVSFESADGETVSKEMEITVFDKYRARETDEFVWGNRSDYSISYEKTDEEVGGRTGVSKYYSPTVNSWNDRLMIYESGHAISGEGDGVIIPYPNYIKAFENLTEKNIQYISFDFYLTEDSLIRVDAPDSTGVRDRRNDYKAGASVSYKQDNKNITLYKDGKKVVSTVIANAWYTVVINHKTAIIGENVWTAIRITGVGTVYLDNIRYYHDLQWQDDFAGADALVIKGELDAGQFTGNSVRFVPVVERFYEEIENADINITVSNENVAMYDASKQILNFIGEGETTVTVSVMYEGKTKTREYNIKVFRYIEKDGSELIVTRAVNSVYSQVSEGTIIGGRFGVYTFINPSSASWNDRIAVKESAHPTGGGDGYVIPFDSPTAAYNNMVSKKYNYVSIDVFFTANSGIKISSASMGSGNAYYARKDYVAGQVVGTPLPSTVTENENISVYLRGVAVPLTDKIYAGKWYTIIIDRKNTVPPSGTWSAIDFAGCFGTVYFDKVRYYCDESCYDDFGYAEKGTYVEYDGSEFVLACAGLNGNSYYEKVNEGTNSGAYKFKASTSDWSEKLGVYETNHIGTKIYPDAPTARTNMIMKRYAYVSFDIKLESGGVAISAPEYTLEEGVYTWVNQTYSRFTAGSFMSGNSRIKLYKNGAEASSVETGAWYTVVIEYLVDVSDTSGAHWAGIDIASINADTVIYLDNVRYYYANPFAI